MDENRTRDHLTAFGQHAMATTLAQLRAHLLRSAWPGLAISAWQYEPPDDKGARAILVTLVDGRKYRLYVGVVPA